MSDDTSDIGWGIGANGIGTNDLKAACETLRRENAQLHRDARQHVEELAAANETLAEFKTQSEAVYDHQYQLTGLLDLEGRLLMANGAALRLIGAEPGDVVGKPFWETPWWAHSQEAQDTARKAIERALSGETVCFETTHPTSEGEIRNFEFCVRPAFSEKGDVQYLVPEGYDITERRNAESQLRESKETYWKLLECASEAVLLIKDGRFSECNSAALRMFACPEQKILGMEPHDRSPSRQPDGEESKRRSEELLDEASTGKPVNFEWRYERCDGSSFPAEVALTAVETYEGLSVLAVIRDITKRKEAEEALRASEEKYRTFFENSRDPMQLLQDGRFIDINASTLDLLEYDTKEEIHFNSPWKLSPDCQPDGRASLDCARDMLAIALEQGSHRFEWDHKKKNGDTLPVEVSLTALSPHEGGALLSVWRDISGRKKAKEERERLESELRQSQKMEAVGQLAGGVAHDFNNIVQGMLGYIDFAEESIERGSQCWRDMEEVKQGAKRAADLIRQLLAFSRRQVLHVEPLDLNGAVEGVFKLVSRLIGEDIELTFSSDPQLSPILADHGQVEQILLNLCVNARDAMPDGGRLTVETSNAHIDDEMCRKMPWAAPGNYALLTVSDSGCGMDEEVLNQIFDPFFTTKGVGEGTGLGLSTVYGIVKQHEGLIDVTSSVGEGTTFRIYLPLTTDGPSDGREGFELPASGGAETILVAEDETPLRQLVARILRKAGYSVIVATDGAEAIDVIQRRWQEIDLALLDAVMPKASGPEVRRVISDLAPKIPVIYSSGYSSETLTIRFGIDDSAHLISKPYKPADLLTMVRGVLDQR